MDSNTKDILTLVIPIIGTALSAWIALKHAQLQVVVKAQDSKLALVAQDVKKVETNTNSMSERLERQAKAAGVGEGTAIEKSAQAEREKAAAIGVELGRALGTPAAAPVTLDAVTTAIPVVLVGNTDDNPLPVDVVRSGKNAPEKKKPDKEK